VNPVRCILPILVIMTGLWVGLREGESCVILQVYPFCYVGANMVSHSDDKIWVDNVSTQDVENSIWTYEM
jgi:hypothetical protein